MAANTTPIYSRAGQISFSALLQTANIAKDGTGATQLIFSAGVDGARVERVRIKPVGTNVATVVRIFINNGSDPTVAANNVLYAEKSIAANTLSESVESALNELPTITDTTAFPLVLPPSYRLYATIGTTVAAGIRITAIGSTY